MKYFQRKPLHLKQVPPSTINLLQHVVILGQFFALFPICRIPSQQEVRFRFTWKSFKTLYSMVSLAGAMFVTFMGTHNMVKNGVTLHGIVFIVFYINASLTVILFVLLAKNWQTLMEEWTKVDKIMERGYGFPKSIHKRLKLTSFTIVFLAAVEHLLSMTFHFNEMYKNSNDSSTSTYYKNNMPEVFDWIHYSMYMAGFAQLTIILSTFSWTFNDLFIIVISTALAARFTQITSRLEYLEKTKHNLWQEIREDYDRLCHLCYILDSYISRNVFLSYVTNLFFVLIQLYNSIQNEYHSMEKVYFYYSFGFLIFRTIAVSLHGAKINDESVKSIPLLHSVPSHIYNNNQEIERLLVQMSFNDLALTGCKLFALKRDIILHVAGAIVTYELVLTQVNAK